ncbi:MAG TPA: hypothetical protein VK449_04850, partial [Anaerolineales bacterium]|nr:hypothetical protein [Anaerolineales bacterium]
LGAQAPAPMMAALPEPTQVGALPATEEAGAELRAQVAPMTAAEAALPTPSPAGAATPAATACPDCPSLDGSANTQGQTIQPSELPRGPVAAKAAAVEPVAAAQWLLGMAAVVLGVLTVWARRR